jgi:hypothetical protein
MRPLPIVVSLLSLALVVGVSAAVPGVSATPASPAAPTARPRGRTRTSPGWSGTGPDGWRWVGPRFPWSSTCVRAARV